MSESVLAMTASDAVAKVRKRSGLLEVLECSDTGADGARVDGGTQDALEL